MDKATLGAGCFWCVEAVFQQLKGVEQVISGYSGGHIKNPAYREVCEGTTGHAEVAQITFDPQILSYSSLLEVFFAVHDPTTLNRQGNDIGTQYRSEIFAHSQEQFEIGQKAIQAANESGVWANPIVTRLSMIGEFYSADNYHQDYYNRNGTEGYCQFVVRPKVEKFKKAFAELLKD